MALVAGVWGRGFRMGGCWVRIVGLWWGVSGWWWCWVGELVGGVGAPGYWGGRCLSSVVRDLGGKCMLI